MQTNLICIYVCTIVHASCPIPVVNIKHKQHIPSGSIDAALVGWSCHVCILPIYIYRLQLPSLHLCANIKLKLAIVLCKYIVYYRANNYYIPLPLIGMHTARNVEYTPFAVCSVSVHIP